jgi:threonine dehydrogenase-like Zn-dependent dehydrogenase/glycosyltransferase involved in cell wall biosynthesis
MNQPAPETSIIIRAMNEERWLPDVFAALAKQNYRDFEVLLVDSGSVDRTRDIGEANGARIVRLRTEDFTFGHSLNVGIAAARGKYMAIISAHAIPYDEVWLEKLIAPLRREEVAMVYGGQRGHPESKFSEWKDFKRVFPANPAHVKNTDPFANNANSAIKKELWHSHPFDEGLPGLEDIEWAKYWMREGRKVAYEPLSCVIHIHTETWAQVRRRYYREAVAARWVGIRWLRNIPGEILRELRWGLGDLLAAANKGRLRALTGEILRFRWEKTIGTVRGIIESKGVKNPARRAELFASVEFDALVARGPGVMRLERRTLPALKPGEVLVRVSHVGLCNADLAVLDGHKVPGYDTTPGYPIVPGNEVSGTIVTLGPRVAGGKLAEGDRVVVENIQGCGECVACRRNDTMRCADRSDVGLNRQDGACAEYFVTRARYVHKVPHGVTSAQATLAGPLAFVLKGLRRLSSATRIDGVRRCAVVGAGTVGHLVARVLASRGHHVTVFDPDRVRLDALRGAVATAQAIGDLAGCDWLIEATGRGDALAALLERAPNGATLLLLGLPYDSGTTNFESIVTRDGAVIGSIGSSSEDYEEALALLPRLDTSGFGAALFPLQQYDAAVQAARSHMALRVMFTTEPQVSHV